MKLMYFDSLESTNKYCKLLDLNQVEEFSIVWAKYQTAGIGQQGNVWESENGKNLTFSIVLHPIFLPASKQFSLTQSISLGLVDFLHDAIPSTDCTIKWPNDIYVGNKKICGFLTENHLFHNHIQTSVCGIGLNVNQTSFPNWLPNPISMKTITAEDFNLTDCLHKLIHAIQIRYNQLKNNDFATINDNYILSMLHYGISARYLYNSHEITATIKGTTPFGHLILNDLQGNIITCDLKEIQFLF